MDQSRRKSAGRLNLLLAPLAGACLLSLVGAGMADMAMDDIHGSYSDDFRDTAGLSTVQNAVVGPYFTPGARLALTTWSWAQSYTRSSDTVIQPFASPGAQFKMTQSVRQCTTCLEMVSLWQRHFLAATDLSLAPGAVSVTWYADRTGPEPGEKQKLVLIPNMELSNSKYVVSGHQTDLVPGEDFTVTFRTSWCDDPKCADTWLAHNAEMAQYEVWLGGAKRASKQICIGQAPQGAFSKERLFSGVTLEPGWPDPLPTPAENFWDYKIFSTMTSTGGTPCYGPLVGLPDCSPNCTATLWVSDIKVMAMGHPVPDGCRLTPADCAPGTFPCRCQCIPDGLQCGWDAATYYVGSGSYLSPVFDSLSENTTWESMWWNIEQNGDTPATPIALKWRVGNTPNPADWQGDPSWFRWTIPMTVTGSGIVGFPPPLKAADSSTLFDGALPAQGRYFQYEADFTNHFANYRSPPEYDPLLYNYVSRDQHDSPIPYLKAIRVHYQPSRGYILSQLIRPSRLRKWKSISYETDVSNGGAIQVDMLDASGKVLFASIPMVAGGFSLASLNPSSYPAVRLRAWMDNGGVPGSLPILKSWSVEWEVTSDALVLDRNSIAASKGESVTVKVNLNGDRDGSLTVHDVAGQLVKVLCRCTFQAGVSSFQWRGSNEKGDAVAPGVYFVSLSAKDIKAIKRLVVK